MGSGRRTAPPAAPRQGWPWAGGLGALEGESQPLAASLKEGAGSPAWTGGGPGGGPGGPNGS